MTGTDCKKSHAATLAMAQSFKHISSRDRHMCTGTITCTTKTIDKHNCSTLGPTTAVMQRSLLGWDQITH
jgi:hypothetical protein